MADTDTTTVNVHSDDVGEHTAYLLDSLDIFDFDKDGYQVRMVARKIPTNTVLIKRNRVTEEWSIEHKTGLVATPRWFATKLVRSTKQKVNFRPQMNLHTKDSYVIPMVDFMMDIILTDPLKFEQLDYKQSKEQRILYRLNLLVDSLITKFIKSNDYSVISAKFNDRVHPFGIGDLDPSDELGDFEAEYGVKVTRVTFQRMEEPVDLEKIAKAKMAEAEAAIKRETEERNAQSRAKVATVEGDARAKVNRKNAEAFRSAGMDSRDAGTVMSVQSMKDLPEGVRPVVTLGNGGGSTDPTAQMAAMMSMMKGMMGGDSSARNASNPSTPVGPRRPGPHSSSSSTTGGSAASLQTSPKLDEYMNLIMAYLQTLDQNSREFATYRIMLSSLNSDSSYRATFLSNPKLLQDCIDDLNKKLGSGSQVKKR